jgi:hypothetical protein
MNISRLQKCISKIGLRFRVITRAEGAEEHPSYGMITLLQGFCFHLAAAGLTGRALLEAQPYG